MIRVQARISGPLLTLGVALLLFHFTVEVLGQSPEMLERGEAVFKKVCVECHGKEGRGDGPKAKRMGFVSRDFALGSFKCRCSPSGALPTDEDLLRTVTEGLPGSPMQALEQDLSLDERMAVVEYIKTFSNRFRDEEAPECISIPPPMPSSPELVEEGKHIYRVLSCWSCHGKGGRGDGPAAADLKDDWGNPIKVHNFVVMRKFKCGNEDRDLYRTLHTGMNGTPMPSYTEAFLFGGEGIRDFSPFAQTFGKDEAEALRGFLEKQPRSREIAEMTAAEKAKLTERRTWALVHYLRSLLRPSR